jgi:hypothetical protein
VKHQKSSQTASIFEEKLQLKRIETQSIAKDK